MRLCPCVSHGLIWNKRKVPHLYSVTDENVTSLTRFGMTILLGGLIIFCVRRWRPRRL